MNIDNVIATMPYQVQANYETYVKEALTEHISKMQIKIDEQHMALMTLKDKLAYAESQLIKK